jgi:Skp family chaperone for outer membrane proteins
VLKVKQTRLWAVAAACFVVFGFSLGSAFAQQGGGMPAGGRQPMMSQPVGASNIALVDIGKVFKEHPRFTPTMNAMKKEVEAAEADLNRMKDEIRRLGDQLQDSGLKRGSPEYRNLEETIARKQADMNVKVAMQRNAFLQQEAKNYYNVYLEIEQELASYCQSRGIDMVLRFSDEKANPDEPQTVLSSIQKPVVWYNRNKGIDITADIINILKSRAGVPASQPPQRVGDMRGEAAPPANSGRPANPFGGNPGAAPGTYGR